MNSPEYQPDAPSDDIDMMVIAGSGPEPPIDSVLREFLLNGYESLRRACARGGLLKFKSLGLGTPWLYRLDFETRGYRRDADGEIVQFEHHTIAARFLPDYLRHADRFAMLRLIEPKQGVFHPNISPQGAVCVEVYPGETIVEICQSLHDLFRWRLRQYDERDALNPAACGWGRQNVDEPIDDRPLFGRSLNLHWQPTSSGSGAEK